MVILFLELHIFLIKLYLISLATQLEIFPYILVGGEGGWLRLNTIKFLYTILTIKFLVVISFAKVYFLVCIEWKLYLLLLYILLVWQWYQHALSSIFFLTSLINFKALLSLHT